MSTVGLIINHRSDRSAAVMDDILNVAHRFGSVRTQVLDGIEGLDRALIDMNRNNVETLIVGGGDGTLQATFTDIMNNGRFERQPRYVALPCGMTNVIANDCGLKGAPAQSLDNFLWRSQRGDVNPTTRPMIKLSVGARDPVFGFFFGAGAFHSAVQFSRDKVQSRGVKRAAALVASVLGYTWKVAMNPQDTADALHVDLESQHVPSGHESAKQRVFVATTLKKLGLGMYPFWGDNTGRMAITAVKQPCARALRAAPFVLLGKPRPWFSRHGYESWNDDKMVAHFDGPFVFDGEIFHAQRSEATVFDCSHNAHFLY